MNWKKKLKEIEKEITFIKRCDKQTLIEMGDLLENETKASRLRELEKEIEQLKKLNKRGKNENNTT